MSTLLDNVTSTDRSALEWAEAQAAAIESRGGDAGPLRHLTRLARAGAIRRPVHYDLEMRVRGRWVRVSERSSEAAVRRSEAAFRRHGIETRVVGFAAVETICMERAG